MIRTVRLAAALLAFGLPAAAAACGASPGLALIHSALPSPLPDGVFIARVEIDRSTLEHYHYRRGVRARVLEVIQGEPDVAELILRSDFTTSCDSPLLNGATGLILALPRGREGGTPVVDPITVHALDGFRLPDGFQLPVECRERACPIELD